MRRAASFLLLGLGALAACPSDQVVLVPVIDAPGGADDPFADLSEVKLEIAFAGDQDEIVSQVFRRGETVELPGAPYGEGLVVHMSGRQGAAEVSYGRTCPYDLVRGQPPPSPHLYFARPARWAESRTPDQPRRSGGLAFAGRDGSAIFLAGNDGPLDGPLAPLVSVERFDPQVGIFEESTTTLARLGGTLATFGDGSALVVGGTDAAGTPLDVAERVDPLAFGPLRVGTIEDHRLAIPGLVATSLSDGSVLVVGGELPLPTPPPPAVLGVFRVQLSVAGDALDPNVDAIITDRPPRTGHTLTRLSNDVGAPVLMLGGVDGAGTPVGAAELFRPLMRNFTPSFTAGLAHPRTRHAAVRLPDGSVLVVGGLDAIGQPVRTMELFSLDGGFVDAVALPAAAGVIDFSLTSLPDGRVLLAGGRTGIGPGDLPLASAYIIQLDPVVGEVGVGRTDDLGTSRAGHQAVLLCDGSVLLLGGTGSEVPAERYNPPSLGRR